MEEDIKILEDMRDEIYGEIQFVDDFDIERKCQKQFDALNLAIKHLRKNNYIPKSKIREKIEELKKEKDKTYTQFLSCNRNDERLSTKGKMIEGAIQLLQELLEEEV